MKSPSTNIIKVVLLLIVSAALHQLSAQEKLKIKQSDESKGQTVNGVFTFKLIGNVILQHNGANIYCDMAILNDAENRMEAFGNVRIVDDSVTITSEKGFYEGNTNIARLQDNVVFRKKGGITLYTDNLIYYRNSRQSKYFGGGRMIDGQNELSSIRGYYNEWSRIASFGEDVKGKSPDWKLSSDTLQYNTYTEIIYFRGPTDLVDEEGKTANYESGFYDTQNKRSSLRNGSFETPSYFLEGNEIEIDDATLYYTATGDVLMESKKEQLFIEGDHGIYNKGEGWTKIYGDALMKKVMNPGDTLFMRADTLLSVESDSLGEILYAYPKVYIFKNDLQGKADSLSYSSSDSLLNLFHDPVLWTQGTQLTSDTMRVTIANGTMDKLIMTNNSFIISQDTLNQFNQIKGRRITSYFNDNFISKVDVSGNGESIYHAIDDELGLLSAVNTIICSNMLIEFNEKAISKVRYYKDSDGSVIPPHEVTIENTRLDGFEWRIKEKPTLPLVLRKILPAEEQNPDSLEEEKGQNKIQRPIKAPNSTESSSGNGKY